MRKLEYHFKEECGRCHSATRWVRWSAKLYKNGKVAFPLEMKTECAVCRDKSMRVLEQEEVVALKGKCPDPSLKPGCDPQPRITPEQSRDPSEPSKRKEDEIPF